jgi:hypothetical protein
MYRSRLVTVVTFAGALGVGAAVASLLAACSGSAKATPDASSTATVGSTVAARHLNLKGTYISPPIKISGIENTGSKPSPFRADGGDIWHGGLEGRTTFVMRGLVNLQTLANHGTSNETFTGSVATLGSGHLHLQDTFTLSEKGVLSLDATVVSGDGALAGVRGRIHFGGKHNVSTGAGTGTYAGTLVTTG